MNLSPITAHLTERRANFLTAAVEKLEAGIVAELVPNSFYNDAKDTISRSVNEATEAFLNTGPHHNHHSQSDWWLAAYHCDAFVSGISNVKSALKRAEKTGGLKEYNALLTAMLPLVDLLQAAKPFIKKKGEIPRIKSAAEIEREGRTMTCQCCGGSFLANTGTIAHHGYQRPGWGWQTASCIGAKHLPFEVDRSKLGEMIKNLRSFKANMVAARENIANERAVIVVSYRDNTREKVLGLGGYMEYPTTYVDFSRENFEELKAKIAKSKSIYGDFDDLKTSELDSRDRQIKSISEDITHCEARFNGWVKTHEWNATAKEWSKI